MKKISLSEVEANDLLDLYQSEIDRAQRRINNLKSIIKKLSDGYSDEHSEEKPAKIKGKRGRRPNVKPVAAKVIIEEKEINEKELTKEPLKKGRKKKEEAEKTAPIKKARNKKTIKAKAPKKSGRKPKSLRKPIKGGKGEDKVKWNDFIIDTIKSKDSLMLASSITQAALAKFEIPDSDRDRVRMAISTTLTKMVNKDKVLQTYSQKGIRGAFFGLPLWFNEKAELTGDYKKKLM